MATIKLSRIPIGKNAIKSLHQAIEVANDLDTIEIPSGSTNVSPSLRPDKNLTLKGNLRKSKIISRENEAGIVLSHHNSLNIENIEISREPNSIGIQVHSSYKGYLKIRYVTMNENKQLIQFDSFEENNLPSLIVEGQGVLEIDFSNIDYLRIDAPNMDVIVRNSHFGSFNTPSVIRAKTVKMYDTHLIETQIESLEEDAHMERVTINGSGFFIGNTYYKDLTIETPHLKEMPKVPEDTPIPYLMLDDGEHHFEGITFNNVHDKYQAIAARNTHIELITGKIPQLTHPNYYENTTYYKHDAFIDDSVWKEGL